MMLYLAQKLNCHSIEVNAMLTPCLFMKNICKSFGPVQANRDINLVVNHGEVHALLGENGAGKSTLMNILYGMFRPTSGEIFMDGKKVEFNTPNDAIAHGIGMVHQHFMLIPEFSVAENIALGVPSSSEPFLNLDEVSRKITLLSQNYGFDITPSDKVRDLPVGSQQRVEIIKALFRGANLLILDEPTAVLTPQEAAQLSQIIRKLADDGKTIIFITHKMEEVEAVASHVTILRDGMSITTVESKSYTKQQLARLMVGRDLLEELPRSPFSPGKTVLSVQNLFCNAKRRQEELNDISLEVHEGEILAIAGVDGNGQTQLVEAIVGLLKTESGSIQLLGEDVTHQSISYRQDHGLAYIPQDRHKEGLALELSLAENTIVSIHGKEPFSRYGWLNYKIVRQKTDALIQEFNVKAPGNSALGKNLSGGNQQKMIFAREFSRNPKILIAAQPTRGLDVGAVEFVHTKLLEARDAGMAILVISTELEECFTLADRLAVMFDGQIMATLSREDLDLERVGLLIAGVREDSSSIKENRKDIG